MASNRKPPVPRDAAATRNGGSTLTDSTGGNAGGAGDVISATRSLRDLPVPTDTPRLKDNPRLKENLRPTDNGRPTDRFTDSGNAADGPGGASILAFPEPKGKRRRRNVVIAAFVAATLTAGIVAAAIYSPALAIRTVTVSGTGLLTTEQVQQALQPVQGVPLPQVAEADVEALLAPLVQIKDVHVQARPPSELVVQVQERVPVALVKQGEQHLLVDVDGVELASGADPASIALPVIDGGAGAIGQELFQATAAVLGALPPEVLARLSNASAQSVDAVELKLIDGQTVVWGNAEDRSLKAKVLQALLQVPADPKNPVRVYDVSTPRNPVTR